MGGCKQRGSVDNAQISALAVKEDTVGRGVMLMGDLRGRSLSQDQPKGLFVLCSQLEENMCGWFKAAVLVVTPWPWEMSTLPLNTFLHTQRTYI